MKFWKVWKFNVMCAETDRLRFLECVQGRAELLVSDGRVVNSIDSLEHCCNVTILSLLQPVLLERNKWTYSRESCIFRCNISRSRSAHTYLVDWPVDCTIPYGQNSFFSWTIRTRNSLCARVVICWLLSDEKGIKY